MNLKAILISISILGSGLAHAYTPPLGLEKGLEETKLIQLEGATRIGDKIIRIPRPPIENTLLDGEVFLQYSPPTGLCGSTIFSHFYPIEEIQKRFYQIKGALNKKYGQGVDHSTLKPDIPNDQILHHVHTQKAQLQYIWSGNTHTLLRFNLNRIILTVKSSEDEKTGQIILLYLYDNFSTCEQYTIDEFDIPGI